jgi:hypothetical protein
LLLPGGTSLPCTGCKTACAKPYSERDCPVIEHRDQVIHRLWNEEAIEKLTAPITHIRAVMLKTLSYRRKRGETISQQSAMCTPSVVRDRQLPDKFSPLILHVVLRFTSFSDNSDLGDAANK